MKTKILVGYSTNRDEKFTKKFNKEIVKSIGCEVAILPYYNSGSKSLAKVYNTIWQGFQFDESYIFVYIHHDIHFKSNGWGKNLLNLFNTSDADIIGVAGTEHLYPHGVWWLDKDGNFNTKDLWGKVWHENGTKKWKSDFTTVNKKCAKLQPTVTVDGLFIAFNPDTCEEFEDENFNSFHFYDTPFCIRNILADKKIYVTETIPIMHESEGPLSQEWEMNRLKFTELFPGAYEVKKPSNGVVEESSSNNIN